MLASLVLAFVPGTRPARAQYALVVNPTNSVADVSFRQVRSIFKAEQQSWGGGRKVYLLLPKSGTEELRFLLDRVYRMSERELARYWLEQQFRNRISARPKALARGRLTASVVARKADAVALMRVEDLPRDGSVKVLAVDGRRPGEPDYPLAADAEWGQAGRATAATAVPAASPYSGSPARADDTSERLEALEGTVDELLGLALDQDGQGGGQPGRERPSLEIHGFGHVEVGAEDSDSGRSSQFALGGLDLFLQSRLSERLSFLSETVFEPTEAGDYVLDVERLILKYEFGDWLNVQGGRFHTTIGHWNETYHHGEWLQTTIGRPRIFDFEDEGGLLPVHLIGLVLKGRQEVAPGSVDYTLEVGNGRGPTPDPPQVIVDANQPKAVNLALGFAPAALPGARLGASVYFDQIPSNPGVHAGMDERILALYGAYQADPWELLAEAVHIAHRRGSGPDTDSAGLYVQVARRFHELAPYARFDLVVVDDADAFFQSNDDEDRYTLGVRWDFAQWSAIKLQYEHSQFDLSSGGRSRADRLRAQVSFAF